MVDEELAWAEERPEWGTPGEWNASQWEARAEYIAANLDPRTACALFMSIGIGSRDERIVSHHLCWFHPHLGTLNYWVTEDAFMRQAWPDLLPKWDDLLASAFARRLRLEEAGELWHSADRSAAAVRDEQGADTAT